MRLPMASQVVIGNSFRFMKFSDSYFDGKYKEKDIHCSTCLE